MSKVVQLVAYRSKYVDESDAVLGSDFADTFVVALTEDGRIFITQNPQLDMGSFSASCWRELESPTQGESATLD